MERIKSFEVDHTKIDKGMYISRIDDDIVTYDIRMVRPNTPPLFGKRRAAHPGTFVCHLCAQQQMGKRCGICRADGLPHRVLFINKKKRIL